MAGPASVDVICAGEAMVDFLPERPGLSIQATDRWQRCPGGAVANVAVGLARLGVSTAMLGVVGEDPFGAYLLQRLAQEGVDVAGMRRTDEGKTGLAFVSLEAGERQFAFFRTRAADLFLAETDIDEARVKQARAVVFGTNALLFREAQRAVAKLARTARHAGLIVAFDPNLRPDLWANLEELRELLALLVPLCSVVKLSEDEVAVVTGEKDPEAALLALQRQGVELPVVTLADKGAVFVWKEQLVRVSIPAVQSVDPTGAGDGFTTGLLFGLTRLYADAAALRFAGVGEIRELVKFGCSVGSRVVQSVGAMNGLPTLAQVTADLPKILRAAPGASLGR